jgi:hypothetical protein
MHTLHPMHPSFQGLIPFAIKNPLNGERGFGRRPALRAGRRLSTGPPPAFGGRRPHNIPPTPIQKLFAPNWYKAQTSTAQPPNRISPTLPGLSISTPQSLYPQPPLRTQSRARERAYPYTSSRAYRAFCSMKRRRGATSLLMRMVKVSSASAASSMVTLWRVRVSGFMVVSHSCSGFISPKPL